MLAAKWQAERMIRDNSALSGGARKLGLLLTSCLLPDGSPHRKHRNLSIALIVGRRYASRRSFFRWITELEKAGIFERREALQWSARRGQLIRRVVVHIASDLQKCQNGAPTPYKERDRRSHYGPRRSSPHVRSGRDPAIEAANQTIADMVTGRLARSRNDVPGLLRSALNVRDMCRRCGSHPAAAPCPA